MLKVWGRTNSINVQKVLWTIAELGLAFERTDAGMQFGVTNSPEYKAMNPNSLIPTLDDDGFVLWESNVIVRYLATKYGMGTLCPSDIEERFLAERWMDWQTTALYPAVVPAFMGLIRNVAELATPAALEVARKRSEHWLAVLEPNLAGRDFLNGGTLTMADIPAGATVNRWYRLPIGREPHPNMERWLARLRTRPGFQAHVDLPLS